MINLYALAEEALSKHPEEYAEWINRCSDPWSVKRMDYDRWTPAQREIIQSHLRQACLDAAEIDVVVRMIHGFDWRMCAFSVSQLTRQLLPSLDVLAMEELTSALSKYDEAMMSLTFRDQRLSRFDGARLTSYVSQMWLLTSNMYRNHVNDNERMMIRKVYQFYQSYSDVGNVEIFVASAERIAELLEHQLRVDSLPKTYAVTGAMDAWQTSSTFSVVTHEDAATVRVHIDSKAISESRAVEVLSDALVKFIDKMGAAQGAGIRRDRAEQERPEAKHPEFSIMGALRAMMERNQ